MEIFQLQNVNELTQEEIEDLAANFKDYEDKQYEIADIKSKLKLADVLSWLELNMLSGNESVGQVTIHSNYSGRMTEEDAAHVSYLVDLIETRMSEQIISPVHFEDFKGSEYNYTTGLLPFSAFGRNYILEEVTVDNGIVVSIIEPSERKELFTLEDTDTNFEDITEYVEID